MRRHLIMTGWRIFELLALASFLLAFFVRNYYPSTTTAFSCPPLLVTESVLLKRNNLLDSSEHRKQSNEKKDISEKAERLKHIRQVSTHPTTVTENEEDRRPIIWVEGLQRSGTTLMRVLLDTDPSINCGPEPMFFWSFFNYLHHVMHGVLSLYCTLLT